MRKTGSRATYWVPAYAGMTSVVGVGNGELLGMADRFAASPREVVSKIVSPLREGMARRKAQILMVSVPKHGGRLSARHMRSI